MQEFAETGVSRQKFQLRRGQYLWPVVGSRVTSRVGNRWGRLHSGIDVAAARGSMVVAATDGTVLLTGDQGAYGHTIFVENNDGTVAWYAHLTDSVVKPGDKIVRGQFIGISGNTGRSTGPHLHFEIRTQQGIVLNPENFFFVSYEEHQRQALEFESSFASKLKTLGKF
ncbi:MAG: M23 family metallopeptidase [Turneriella sp.]|nr:M23 family metallopeptidase [Leptospiraceae bacterium]MCX7633203.1 M23 family metallopeptidase [Turneriella sp.]